jgi:hypothetical protein
MCLSLKPIYDERLLEWEAADRMGWDTSAMCLIGGKHSSRTTHTSAFHAFALCRMLKRETHQLAAQCCVHCP